MGVHVSADTPLMLLQHFFLSHIDAPALLHSGELEHPLSESLLPKRERERERRKFSLWKFKYLYSTSSLPWPCQWLCAGLKEELRCVLAFSDPRFSIIIVIIIICFFTIFQCLSQMFWFIFSIFSFLSVWLVERVKLWECCSGGGTAADAGGEGIMVQYESLLSNGAFSHQHRPRWRTVPGCSGVSASTEGERH